MKLAYITGDIQPNGNFTLYHDLLANYPTPEHNWFHRLYLVQPNWDRNLVHFLKERYIDVRSCFEEFQASTDEWWAKIKEDTADCDVIISGNITNLDEVIPDDIQVPVVSLSLCEKGYRSESGGYGSFYKERFRKAAVSRTAVTAFPEAYRSKVEVVYSGLDPSRVNAKVPREQVRSQWFPGESENVKLMLFIGTHAAESKGLAKTIEALEHLPPQWHLIILSAPGNFAVPEHLRGRVKLCNPTTVVGDIYDACDCLVLPTEHEGFSMSLLEAWYNGCPVVTTEHSTIKELQTNHPDVSFGSLVPVACTPTELSMAVSHAKKSDSAQELVRKEYMANNMVERWKSYLQKITGKE